MKLNGLWQLPVLAAGCGLALSLTQVKLQPAIETSRENYAIHQLLSIIGEPEASIEQLGEALFRVDGNNYLFAVTTNEGYNGRIDLWLGIDVDGVIEGVRVHAHAETPGLGDKIDHRLSDWIHGFKGHSLRTPDDAWDVRRHGGEFDQFTGATITPRAVIHAVRQGLEEFREHQPQWQTMRQVRNERN